MTVSPVGVTPDEIKINQRDLHKAIQWAQFREWDIGEDEQATISELAADVWFALSGAPVPTGTTEGDDETRLLRAEVEHWKAHAALRERERDAIEDRLTAVGWALYEGGQDEASRARKARDLLVAEAVERNEASR